MKKIDTLQLKKPIVFVFVFFSFIFSGTAKTIKMDNVFKVYSKETMYRTNGDTTKKSTENQGISAFNPNVVSGFDQSERRKVVFYPNPATDFVNIEFYSSKNQITRVVLFDLIGNQILNFDIEAGNTNLIKKRIDLVDLNPGAYFLSVIGDTKQTFKILKRGEQ